jgi:threonine/homoserine/homoserine lactone efflux protein
LPSLGWGYRRALLTCALNPKLGVFFVVFLPQFIPAGANVAQTSLALATLQAGEAVLWYLLLGQLAAGAGQLLIRQRDGCARPVHGDAVPRLRAATRHRRPH